MKSLFTKTKYVQLIQCPKSFWLNEFNPKLKEGFSDFDKLKLAEGNQVGKLATAHPDFKGGVLIPTLNFEDAVHQTKLNLVNPEVKFIYEAAFKVEINNVVCGIRVDILKKNEDDSLSIIEVKSSTKVKDEYLHDLAFQKTVIEHSGFHVSETFLMHVNKQYEFKNNIMLDEFFTINPIISDLEPFSRKVVDTIDLCFQVSKVSEEPSFEPGSHCSSPHLCPFFSHCNKKEQDSVNNLRNLHYKKKEKLKEKNITKLTQISELEMLDFTETQQIQILCAKNPTIYHLEKEPVTQYIKTLSFPLHFLDFEALLSAIPYFDGMKPQQFVVYQASIHKLASPNKKVSHSSYLHENATDPRKEIINFLKNNLSDAGSIIVYHKQFEETQLLNLKRDFPEFGSLIDSWVSRLWDLEKIFSNFWFYDNKQSGSTSIKKVCPVLVPNLSYDTLTIKDGNSSVTSYLKLIRGDLSFLEKEQLKKHLDEYNTLDTLAMVKILNKIKWLTARVETA